MIDLSGLSKIRLMCGPPLRLDKRADECLRKNWSKNSGSEP